MAQTDAKNFDYTILDVFTTQRFKGNPLAIVRVPDSSALTQEQKLAVTSEFNLSETVFLYQLDDGARWGVDIFTIGTELPFAGHPTVGSSWYIANHQTGKDRAVLVTKAKAIDIRINRGAGSGTVLDVQCQVPAAPRLHQALLTFDGAAVLQTGLREATGLAEAFPVFSIVNGMTFALVELDSIETLSKLRASSDKTPKDFIKLDGGWDDTLIGAYFYVVGDAKDDENVQLHCRMFLGLLEDSATGSAASSLCAYLSSHRLEPPALGSRTFQIEQGLDMGRKSDIVITVDTGGPELEMTLGGSCVHVMSGQLTV